MSTPELARPDLTLSTESTGDAPMTIMVTGDGQNSGTETIWIVLPGSGQLEVIYEYQDQPAATAILWHQGGNYQNLVPGSQIYNSAPGDALYFQMAYENQSIKVGWAYV